MKRVFIYPNITSVKEPGKDRYLQFLKKLIFSMKLIRNDIFWYCVIPGFEGRMAQKTKQIKELLNLSNIRFLEVPIPGPPSHRYHFDVFELARKVQWKDYSIDVVLTNLPELTTHLKTFFYDYTNVTPKVLGFSHWDDNPLKMGHGAADREKLLGIMEMDAHFFNTDREKRNALDAARKIFNRITVNELSQKLHAMRVPIRYAEQVRSMDNDYLRMIVFNHRPSLEKTFPEFIKAMNRLWGRRQDFRVWIPYYPKKQRSYEWLFTEVPITNRDKYYYGLRRSYFGVSPAQKFGHWSASTADGLLNGVPYIMYDADYYRELNPNADFYRNQTGLLELANLYLDDDDYRNTKVHESLKTVFNTLILEENTRAFSDKINELYSAHRSMKNDITRDMIRLIKMERRMTQRELMKRLARRWDWDKNIKFNGYRKSILADRNIYEAPGEWKTEYVLGKEKKRPLI